MPHVRRGVGPAALTISIVALSACSSGTPTSSGTTVKQSGYHASAEYLGVSAGKADSSKSPLTLGWVNEQGGSSSSPEATAGALYVVAWREFDSQAGMVMVENLRQLTATGSALHPESSERSVSRPIGGRILPVQVIFPREGP